MTNNGESKKIMRALCSPAITLMNRLGYTKKFTLLWLVSLVATTVVAYSFFVSLERIIHPSQRQLEGIALIKPISKTVQLIQLHRGISALLLGGGNETMRDRRAAKEREAVEAFNAMEGKLPHSLVSNGDFQRIKANWEQLRKEQYNWTADESFTAHTRLIGQILLFETLVADEYGLTLDTEIATYYLLDTAISKLPHALEHLGQIRAYSIVVLAKKQITERQKALLNAQIIELGSKLGELRINLEKTSRYNPAMQTSVSAASKGITNLAQRLTGLVESDILAGHFVMLPDDFLYTATVEIDKGYKQLDESLLTMAETLIKARIAKVENEFRKSVGIAFMIFLVLVYFSVSMYYAIVGSIQLLARSARSFASGNLRERINLGTRDELSWIGDSFNEMADGFSAMLEVHYEDEARLHATIETAMDAVVKMNSEGIIIDWNGQAGKIFGWPREEALGRALYETIIPPQYREAHVQGMKRFLATGEGHVLNKRIEIIGLHRDGHELPVEMSVASITVAGKYEFSAFIRDVTVRKESEDLIWKQTNFDTLTGLPNRHMFYDRLAQDIKKAQRTGLRMALLFIDLDKFKEVNDSLGHSMGDILLVEAARRIGDCVRETDTVARFGGDEFIIILAKLDNTGNIERVAANILQKLAEPFQLGNELAYVSASIGITLYPDDATEVEDLLKNADQAMYTAKNKGRNRFGYFTPSMQEAAQARLCLIRDLRGALAANQFRVYYQPVVELATGRINKMEALIRWQHPERGLISPSEFIPLAEETGLIVEIGDWMFKECARQLKHWRALYNPKLQASVNVSPVQLCNTVDLTYRAWFTYLLDQGLPGQSMVIEITEGLLLDADSYIAGKLLEFRDAGMQVSIDDFGTGYSSLSYLKKFDIDYLKIDQSFVRNLAENSNDMALSEAIIVMAHKLGLKVIAEGVETEAQFWLLSDAGCDYAQGYLFSKPVSAEEFEELLKD